VSLSCCEEEQATRSMASKVALRQQQQQQQQRQQQWWQVAEARWVRWTMLWPLCADLDRVLIKGGLAAFGRSKVGEVTHVVANVHRP
jgi:hypothetical protein